MIEWILTGGLIPPLLLTCGAFFFVYLRGEPFRSPQKALRAMRGMGEGNGVSPFRAVTEALAGTLGVGNIVGVANAISVGGAGAIFWMWISALLAAVLKYAEILLAVVHRRTNADGSHHGGAFYYLKDHFFSCGRNRTAVLLSTVFALFMILNALSTGCVVQVRAVTSALQNTLPIPTWGLVGALLLLTLPLLWRGRSGVSALTEYLVPVMTVGYILLSVIVLCLRWDALGEAFSSIFSGAFSIGSAAGGAIGFFTSRALRVGTMRGLLSNEAGCGTSPTAHAAANARDPASQGIWGIFEVLVDTVLLCTLTALVILVSYDEVAMLSSDGVLMAIRAYSAVLGGVSDLFFAIAIFCFGYATLLCWGGYGLESVHDLSRRSLPRVLYFLSFGACIAVGAYAAPEAVWDIADLSITVLTTINLTVLFRMRSEVRAHTQAWRRMQSRDCAGDTQTHKSRFFCKKFHS